VSVETIIQSRRNLIKCQSQGHLRPKWVVRDMSASPPIATEERTSRHVSNVQQRNSPSSFDHLVGSGKQPRRHD
jgi:hypothetical protein